jgi:uncharacterized protein with HEPN domain
MNDERKLQDILNSIQMIESFALLSYDEFIEDFKTQNAILYSLIIIGEAASHISEEYKELHYEIPWTAMIGTRNIIAHGYDQVKLPIVWEIIQNDLSTLKTQIESILNET